MQSVSVADEHLRSSLVKVLHYLYNNDILSEEVIISWHSNVATHDEDLATRQAIRKQVTSFVTWLQEAEEESDSD